MKMGPVHRYEHRQNRPDGAHHQVARRCLAGATVPSWKLELEDELSWKG